MHVVWKVHFHKCIIVSSTVARRLLDLRDLVCHFVLVQTFSAFSGLSITACYQCALNVQPKLRPKAYVSHNLGGQYHFKHEPCFVPQSAGKDNISVKNGFWHQDDIVFFSDCNLFVLRYGQRLPYVCCPILRSTTTTTTTTPKPAPLISLQVKMTLRPQPMSELKKMSDLNSKVWEMQY